MFLSTAALIHDGSLQRVSCAVRVLVGLGPNYTSEGITERISVRVGGRSQVRQPVVQNIV